MRQAGHSSDRLGRESAATGLADWTDLRSLAASLTDYLLALLLAPFCTFSQKPCTLHLPLLTGGRVLGWLVGWLEEIFRLLCTHRLLDARTTRLHSSILLQTVPYYTSTNVIPVVVAL